MYEKKISGLVKQLKDEHAHCENTKQQLDATKKLLNDGQNTIQVSYLCSQWWKGGFIIFLLYVLFLLEFNNFC